MASAPGRLRHVSEAAIDAAAERLGVVPAVVRAVAEVESRGSGFLNDGRPVILFEGHKFSERTGHIFDLSHPTISYRRWTREHYLGGGREYARLYEAAALDQTSALWSTSWGAFQIMGFNASAAGSKSLVEFVLRMHRSADEHLRAFVCYVESQKLGGLLREQNWRRFARLYNGSGYAANKYDERLAAAFEKHSGTSRSA